MAVINKSSSDTANGFDSNEPLNSGVVVASDQAFGSERWQLTKGSAWPYRDPYRTFIRPSHTSVVIQDLDPYDLER